MRNLVIVLNVIMLFYIAAFSVLIHCDLDICRDFVFFTMNNSGILIKTLAVIYFTTIIYLVVTKEKK